MIFPIWLLPMIFPWHCWRKSDNLWGLKELWPGILSVCTELSFYKVKITTPKIVSLEDLSWPISFSKAQNVWGSSSCLTSFSRYWQGSLWGWRFGQWGTLATFCLFTQNIYLCHYLEARIVLISNFSTYFYFLLAYDS